MNSRYWLSVAMREHGGGFVRALGEVVLRADDENFRRIGEAFPEYVAKYSSIAEKMKQEDEKNHDTPTTI